jgi:hypothetical protein
VKAKDLVKRSLNRLQRDIAQRFDEISEVVESLKPADAPTGAVLTNDKIMREIQAAVAASEDKDRILKQKQLVIESMSYSLNEREERASLRKQLAVMQEDIAAEIARFTDADNEYEFKIKEVERLTNDLAQSASRSEHGEARLRLQIEREMAKQKRDFEEEQKASDVKVQQLRQELNTMKQQLRDFSVENQKLARSVPKVTEADLHKIDAKVKEQLRDVVNKLALGVNKMIAASLKVERMYGGGVVRSAMKTALTTQAQEVLRGGGDDEEDEYEDGDE